MTLRMLDSITPANLPAGADAYLGYVDGRWPDFQAEVKRFPGAHILSISVRPADDAEGCDCETGDLAIAQVPGWVKRQRARGVHRPVVYASAVNMPAVVAALAAAGIDRSDVRLLSAHYGQGKHICGPATCAQKDSKGRVVPACDGTQWTDDAPGVGVARVDESVLADDFFARVPVARTADGHTSWRQLAHAHTTTMEHSVWLTARHAPGGFGPHQAAHVAAGDWDALLEAGTVVWTWS